MAKPPQLYELLYIIDVNLEESVQKKQEQAIKDIILKCDGEIKKETNWGRRRLAYEINKKTEGTYICLEFTANNEIPTELNYHVHTHTEIIRHLLIKVPKAKLIQERMDAEKLQRQKERAEKERELAEQAAKEREQRALAEQAAKEAEAAKVETPAAEPAAAAEAPSEAPKAETPAAEPAPAAETATPEAKEEPKTEAPVEAAVADAEPKSE